MTFPREFKRTGVEQVDWKLMGFGACVFVVAFGFIALCTQLPEPVKSAEDIERLQRRVAQVAMPELVEPPPPPPEPEVVEVPEVVEEEVPAAQAEAAPSADQPRERTRQRAGGGGRREESRASRAQARAALAQSVAQQGVWAQLSTSGGGSGVAANFGAGAADLETSLGQVGGVKRGGQSTFTGEGGGTAPGEGAIVGPGGGRSVRGGGEGMDVGALLGGGGGIGGGGATSLGGEGPVGGVDIADVAVGGDAGAASSAERSDAAIQAVMRQNLGPIRFCYERELKLNPNLQGSIKVRLTIQANGRVSKVDIIDDTVGNTNLARCVQGRIRAWRFKPVPSGTSIVNITLPFSPV